MLTIRIIILFVIVVIINAEWVELPSLDPTDTKKPGDNNYRDEAEDEHVSSSDNNNNTTSKPSTAQHFIEEITVAHQKLREMLWPNKKEPKTLKEKLHYLTVLRNHILNNIARTMFGMNSEDAGKHMKRMKRGSGWGSGDQSEIGFPSLEVALLTLAFLVFAVFLVNMVLVLFSNIFGTTTTTNTTGQAVGRRKKRNAEEIKNEETIRIMKAIEEFPGKHRQTTSQCYADSSTPCDENDPAVPQIAKFLMDLKI